LPESPTQVEVDLPPISDLYSISYVYYSCLGFAATLVIGIVVGLISCKCCFENTDGTELWGSG